MLCDLKANEHVEHAETLLLLGAGAASDSVVSMHGSSSESLASESSHELRAFTHQTSYRLAVSSCKWHFVSREVLQTSAKTSASLTWEGTSGHALCGPAAYQA
jgi:hypothetical protein